MAKQFIGGTGWEVKKTLDAAFILDRGWLINTGDGEGIIHGVKADDSKSEGGIIGQDNESVLSAPIACVSMSILKMWIPNSLLNVYCKKGVPE